MKQFTIINRDDYEGMTEKIVHVVAKNCRELPDDKNLKMAMELANVLTSYLVRFFGEEEHDDGN